jgi:hypothetical protein
MEPTHAKPVKKRRRWLIVAFVLVLVSLVSWWYWPRGDARFVGRWAAYTNGDADEPEAFMDFWTNGSSTWTSADRPGWTHATVWRANRETLQFGLKASARVTIGILTLQEWFNTCFSVNYRLNEHSWDILSVAGDRIELVDAGTRYKKNQVTMTLRRMVQ